MQGVSDMTDSSRTVELVRSRYAAAAVAVARGDDSGSGCCGGGGAAASIEVDESFGADLYAPSDTDALPERAVLASLGCGNPTAVADLRAGERVLDLGSGGGIDVLLSARRVGPSGFAWGVDMTTETLELARANADAAGVTNVEFLQGRIEAVPLADAAVDVVISNCVVNLSVDKAAVLGEMHRVLVAGGRIGISDVVAEDDVSPDERAERGSYVGCVAGALSRSEYLAGLTAAGFTQASVEFTHEVAPGMHGAIIRATRPIPTADPAEPAGRSEVVDPASGACCSSAARTSCCEPQAKTACCGSSADTALTGPAPTSCGCR